MGKSIVSIVKGNDIEKMVTEALFHLGGVKKLIRPKSTVVIKPNAGHLNGPDTSVNTNPDVAAAVIKEIRKANPKEIILAESAAIGCDTMECLEISGIKKAAEEAGLDKIIDIKKEIQSRRCLRDYGCPTWKEWIYRENTVLIRKTHVAVV